MSKPYLDAHLDIGFFRFRTMVMFEIVDRAQFTYISVLWVFFRWGGEFRLYSPEHTRLK